MNLARILLGASAVAVAVASAAAEDFPFAPEPVDSVRVCDAFGPGFVYIPHIDTCLSVRGGVGVEYRFNNFGDRPNAWTQRGANGTSTRPGGNTPAGR